MRIMFLELKRVIKSPMTWISATIAIALSVVISFAVISYSRYVDVDKNGNKVLVTGRAAIRTGKRAMKPYEGPLSEQKLQQVLKTYQTVYKKYGKDIPIDVYREKLLPINSFLDMISEVYSGGINYFESLNKIKPEDIINFYKQRSEMLKTQLEAKYPNNADAQKEVMALNQKVKTPFIFYQGYTGDAADNLAILISLLVLICAVIVSPIFSAEYQNGSDDILRCTKYGKTRLAATKLCASLFIVFAMFTICISIFVLIVNSAYGWDSLQTSAQVLSSALSFLPLTMSQEQELTILAGLITLLAVACFTLFISAKCYNPTTTLVIAIAFCLLPVILYSVGQGNFINLLVCLLPAGGSGLTNSFYFQLRNTLFLQIGSFSIWAPYLMMGAAIIEIPMFFILSIHTYCKHQTV